MNCTSSFILSLFLTLSAAAPAAGSAAESQEGRNDGVLTPDTCLIDLGEIPADTVATGSLHFRNTGEAPLQILSIFTDCGCTSTSHTSEPVDPGESGEVEIRFNSRGRRPGPFRKTLRIRSDAANPRVTVTVKGIII